MRGSDQVHEGRARRNRSSKRGVVQSVADAWTAADGSLRTDWGRASACMANPRSSRAVISGLPRYLVPPVMNTGLTVTPRCVTRNRHLLDRVVAVTESVPLGTFGLSATGEIGRTGAEVDEPGF